ncbi:MAG TPA: OsmC family protein [Stellaceae bacterium]|nr:OsmC family protein [Stellaceae bacterium]
MSEAGGIVAGAIVELDAAAAPYAVKIRAGHHTLVADEPVGAGGGDAGASPFGLLLSSLGACTAITLRMYAERKKWPLAGIQVRLAYRWDGDTPHIDRDLTLEGLDAEQRARCAEIAEKTPVTRALKRGLQIETRLR